MLIKAEPHLGLRRWKLPWKLQQALDGLDSSPPGCGLCACQELACLLFLKLLVFHHAFSLQMGTDHFDLPSPGGLRALDTEGRLYWEAVVGGGLACFHTAQTSL